MLSDAVCMCLTEFASRNKRLSYFMTFSWSLKWWWACVGNHSQILTAGDEYSRFCRSCQSVIPVPRSGANRAVEREHKNFKTKNLLQTKKISVVCFSETLCASAFPVPHFDSRGQNPYRKWIFIQGKYIYAYIYKIYWTVHSSDVKNICINNMLLLFSFFFLFFSSLSLSFPKLLRK